MRHNHAAQPEHHAADHQTHRRVFFLLLRIHRTLSETFRETPIVLLLIIERFSWRIAAIPTLQKQPAPSKTPPDYQSCRFILSNCRLSRLVGRPSG